MVRLIAPRHLTRNQVVTHARLVTTRCNATPTLRTVVRVAAPRRFGRSYASSAVASDLEAWRTEPSRDTISDTIYALSSAPGRAAIAVIRLSGPACLDVYRRLCPNRPLPKPRNATLRRLYDPDDAKPSHDRVIDSGALVLYFPAPNTVTGEDVLELHVHGGPAIVRSVLEAISACGPGSQHLGIAKTSQGGRANIRLAEPGEFTKRAFYNGRLDLTQAEALGETLAAETEQQRRLAVSGTDGGLAKRYEEWRTMLLYARGELEALIDFSEDQHFDESPVEFITSVSEQVKALKRQVQLHIKNASKGELLRNGISIALLGAPNAGKSSLLNRIVGREAAIVSAEAGTTRDIVDVTVDINGWLCRLGDMAGLRSTADADTDMISGAGPVGLVEQEGIRRARERALHSDVVVALLAIGKTADGSLDVPVNAQVIEAVEECSAAGKMILVVLNKMDLVEHCGHGVEVLESLRAHVSERFPMVLANRVCPISCRETASESKEPDQADPGGIQAFLAQLTRTFGDLTTAATGEAAGSLTPAEAQSYWSSSLSVTHRQSTYLKQCLNHLDDFLEQCQPQNHHSVDPSLSRGLDEHEGLVGAHAVQDDIDIVTAAEHLRFAADCLAKITGKGGGGDVEDVLGVVFEK
ncbi:tRNA modification GTPase [Capronia coronata CBS 617.96]|uniref:tRNA modification GTPase n=1 Tax=Capronia coronata CBS 617.96 TaxID=1182541 RepID=W9Y6B8_9EURO|nr:tRNA modification GTPase [Capronia coronata CBS 617.96]EXJ88078.1 tRNA modification GTPase [Capronia coronata CBS 617.96]